MSMANDTFSERREALKPAVERSGEDLREALDQLQEAVQKKLSFAERIAEQPWPWIAGAFVIGLWFGSSRRD